MNSKKVLLNVVVSLVVAIGVLFAYDQFFNQNKDAGVQSISQDSMLQSRVATYNAVKSGKMTPVDFTFAAELSTPAVVHVKKTYKVEYTSINPFEGFFDYFNSPKSQPRSQLQTASGSGVIISSDGYIVSNNHVVENAEELEVTLYDNRTVKAELIGTDPSTDIALLKIDEENLPAIPFGNSDSVKVGEWVLAVGNPFDLTSTVTAGIVSAKGRNINILRKQSRAPIESFIQTDAAVNPGNSGGALVDLEGELIGINTAIATPTGTYAGYSFAVPANIVRKVITDLRKYGVVQRPYLGVRIRDVNTELAKEEDLSISQGVYVASINEGSAAENAGLEAGDVITGINGETVTNVAELQEKISLYRPGDKVNVMYVRNGKETVKEVELYNRMNTTELLEKGESQTVEILGAKLKSLEVDEARKLRVQGGVQVTDIEDGTLAENTNISDGFVILEINEKPVQTVDDAVNILSKTDEGDGIIIKGMYPGNPSNIYTYVFRK